MSGRSRGRLSLPEVTLCSAACVNVEATLQAMSTSLDYVRPGDCVLFTDRQPASVDKRIRVELIERIDSSAAYSRFMLSDLPTRVRTGFALTCQWDGFVIGPESWSDEFLACDYIGAVWPQFTDRHVVGNGGFSLRSRRLLDGCLDPRFEVGHPEDVAIGRTNRPFLEASLGCVFAEPSLAARFSFEREAASTSTFGFHGVFNMPAVLGNERFTEVYRLLDERTSVWHDFWPLLRDLGRGRGGLVRQAAFASDRLKSLLL